MKFVIPKNVVVSAKRGSGGEALWKAGGIFCLVVCILCAAGCGEPSNSDDADNSDDDDNTDASDDDDTDSEPVDLSILLAAEGGLLLIQNDQLDVLFEDALVVLHQMAAVANSDEVYIAGRDLGNEVGILLRYNWTSRELEELSLPVDAAEWALFSVAMDPLNRPWVCGADRENNIGLLFYLDSKGWEEVPVHRAEETEWFLSSIVFDEQDNGYLVGYSTEARDDLYFPFSLGDQEVMEWLFTLNEEKTYYPRKLSRFNYSPSIWLIGTYLEDTENPMDAYTEDFAGVWDPMAYNDGGAFHLASSCLLNKRHLTRGRMIGERLHFTGVSENEDNGREPFLVEYDPENDYEADDGSIYHWKQVDLELPDGLVLYDWTVGEEHAYYVYKTHARRLCVFREGAADAMDYGQWEGTVQDVLFQWSANDPNQSE